MYFNIIKGLCKTGECMYDIHCHIVPCVDDGSGSITDSVEMALLAVKNGTKAIIATPHCNLPGLFESFWSEEYTEKIRKLNAELKKRDIQLTVFPGQEIFAHGDILPRLKNGELITLNKSRYVLVEFDFSVFEDQIYPVIAGLSAEGYIPIVAHPERYSFVYENPQSVEKMRSSGALVQVNAGSLVGELGLRSKLVSGFILENRYADFVASDAHSQYYRTTDLSAAHEIVCGYYGYDYAELIFETNPLNVINNKEIR